MLHNSNRLAVRLMPCDVLARVAPVAHQGAQFEVEVAPRLAEAGCPVAALEPRVEPRVYVRDGFVITLWTYYEPVPPEIAPAEYAERSSGCMPACARSISRRRTSRIESRRRSGWWRAAPSHRSSPTRTGSCSATRCGV